MTTKPDRTRHTLDYTVQSYFREIVVYYMDLFIIVGLIKHCGT